MSRVVVAREVNAHQSGEKRCPADATTSEAQSAQGPKKRGRKKRAKKAQEPLKKRRCSRSIKNGQLLCFMIG